jgi:adenylate kinase
MSLFIVLLGPPGAGKGTQANRIAEDFGLAHNSSGALFRENLKLQTDLGKKAQDYINRGELVPDEITIGMVRDRLGRPDCEKGALLDGFPRTPAQAEALDKTLAAMDGKVFKVPYIAVPSEVLIERLSGRWSCRAEGHVYHSVFNPPQQAGVCDIDGSELYQREDDKPETVKNRIRVYLEQTAPLISYYEEKGLLVEVDGTASIEEVGDVMMAALKKEE